MFIKFKLMVFALLGLCIFPGNLYAQTEEVSVSSGKITIESKEGGFIEILEAEGAEVRDVLEQLSQKLKYKIIVDDDVRGKVNIFLTDIELRDALRIILQKLDLAYSEETGVIGGENEDVIRVMSQRSYERIYGYAFGKEIQTRIIPLVYIEEKDISDLLNHLKTPAGRIIFNGQTKSFVLMDSPIAVKAMESIIKEMDVPIENKEFTLKNAKAAEVGEKVKDYLTKNVGRMQIDKEKNSITITDKLLKIEDIGKMIRNFDFSGKKIQMDIKVVQIILSDEHETGVDWEAIVSGYKSANFAAFDSTRILPKDKDVVSLGTITSEDLVILTEALETVGDIKTVFVDQETAENRGEAGLIVPVGAVKSVENVVILKEQPRVVGDIKFYVGTKIADENALTINITPAHYQIADKEALIRKRQNLLMRGVSKGADIIKSATRALPGIGDERVNVGDLIEVRSTAPVSLEVSEGGTVVVGGMIKEIMVRSRRKIPLLGDLPILGFAFQSEAAQMRNSEVIIFLTFKVVSE